ncbi:hypothetical protein ACH5AO_04350 [Streptomyces sp. NPDC018964]|jgi:hypothetical protein|uniref:hypothetical protein n=1 Tax=unclassified Streptomyces TaxID=2593676 RepID=UPI0037A1F4E7
MKFKSAVVCAFAVLAFAGGAAGTAWADDGARSDPGSDEQTQSCEVSEVIDQSNLSASDNNIDCSRNVKKETDLVRVVNDAFLPVPREDC